jgi:hypothetical protein
MGAIRLFTRHGQGVADGFPDHPAMNTELARYAGDRSLSELILSSDVLKQFHL